MTNPTPATPEPFVFDSGPRSMAVVSYGLFLGGFIIPVLPIAGLILAFIKKGEAVGTPWASHFENIIFTFWVSLVAVVLSIVLMLVGIGLITALLVSVWVIYRMVLGVIKIFEGKPFAPLLPFEPGYVKAIA